MFYVERVAFVRHFASFHVFDFGNQCLSPARFDNKVRHKEKLKFILKTIQVLLENTKMKESSGRPRRMSFKFAKILIILLFISQFIDGAVSDDGMDASMEVNASGDAVVDGNGDETQPESQVETEMLIDAGNVSSSAESVSSESISTHSGNGNGGIPKLFPYGLNHIDANLPRDVDDVSSREIRLQTPIVLYGHQYTSVFVSHGMNCDIIIWN